MGIVMELFRERGFQVKKKGRGFRDNNKDTFVLQLQEHMERPQLKYFGTYFI
jgi:hypothetical protein